ncbi:Putative bifunctional phosphatase/peptidyl-prolyl cis-trans isomerase [uncultured Clostridium sp.]|uniref:HAD family hydrolase n=1 Tax=uncultured Clostridium sp. TaxID=59620 RepID=UPI000822C6F7|nr:HAD family hydrolase [uncultured Clostridium sp.]SCI98382.1 Putative bifunctional phosphatase/peptidyl-prolyl cis-trans isomerase [uncultured Clostridium sp.]
MKRNIVFFDIDGTLIDEHTLIIPESTKKALKEMRTNGHLAFINTGRTACQTEAIRKEFDFDGFICGCGTYVEYEGEVLFHKSLGHELTSKLVKALKKYRIDGVLESIDGVYYDDIESIRHPEVFKVLKIHKTEGSYNGKTWFEKDLNVDKLVIFLNKESNFDGFLNEFKDIFDFIKRAEEFYELVPLNYSKATGIEFIINELNIPFENTYAIGDSTNDLTMLKYVENSIAMGNSNPVLFDLVKFVTKDINEDGIEYALKHYEMI